LQSLDEDVDKDFSNLNRRQQVMTFWQKIAQFRFSKDTIMAEVPIVFDYENFTIDTWGEQEIFMTHGEKKRYQLSQHMPLPNVLSAKEDEPQDTQIHVPVCVDFSSSTPELYKQIDGQTIGQRPNHQLFESALLAGDLGKICENIYNVFDSIVTKEHLELNYIKSIFNSYGAVGMQMTGSGSAVFCIVPEFEFAAVICSMLKENYPQVYIAKAV
jgi:hypothetical protein